MSCLSDPLCFDTAILECLSSALRALELMAYRVFGPEIMEIGDALLARMDLSLDSFPANDCLPPDSGELPGA